MAFFSDDAAGGPGRMAGLRGMVARRLTELWGALLVGLGLALALALGSYDTADPSHFSARGGAPANWLGIPGAVLADPLIRMLGLAAVGPALFLLTWGMRLLLHSGEERVWARLLALPAAVPVGAVFASTHAPPAGWPQSLGLGGVLGDAGLARLLALWPGAPGDALLPLGLGLGVVCGVLWALALGVTRSEAAALSRWMLVSMGRGAAALGRRAWRARRGIDRRAARQAGAGGPAVHAIPGSGSSAPVPEEAGREESGSALTAAIRALRDGHATAPAAEAEPARSPRAAPAEARTRTRTRLDPVEADEGSPDETLAPDPEAAPSPPPVYDAPSLSLLERPGRMAEPPVPEEVLEQNARQLETVLADYGVRGEITAVKAGPVVTLYELEPAPGLKASRVIGLADDIARSMSALSARVSTVPGRTVIGIELPNDTRQRVLLREVLEAPDYRDTHHPLALALGKTIEGAPVVANLARMPHLLIAGTTGSGKSVAINTMILSLLYRLSPEQCRIIMIDPKMLELSVYDSIPHLLAPVVTDPKKAVVALKWVVAEMEERYRRMSKMGVRNIDGYNARLRQAEARGEAFTRTVQTGFDEETGEPVYETETIAPEPMPLIVVVVDEMADLMMVAGKEIEACIQRLAQMARASGIHLIMATQRPSVDVITGTIKANFPTRISFQVTSKIDSRTILGEQGAEQLLGQGDMLYMAGGGRIRRVHGPFVSDDEVEEVVRHLKTLGAPDYVDSVTDGPEAEDAKLVDEKLGLGAAGDSDETLYDKAVAVVARDRKCSTSYIQRKLQIGYNKAARLVEEMEGQGVVTPANAVGKREILIEER